MTGQQKYHKLCMLRIKPKPTATPTLTHTITPKHYYRTGNEELHTKKEVKINGNTNCSDKAH